MKPTETEARLKFFCFIVAVSNFVLFFFLWAIYKMMNQSKFEIKDLLYLVIIGIAAYFIFQLNAELSGNKKALEKMDDQIELQKQENQKEIERLSESVDSLKTSAEKDITAASRYQQEKDQLKNEAYENAPYRITDADSLARLITRRAKRNR